MGMSPPTTAYIPPARVTVVVPTFNERDNLPTLARRIFAAVDPQHCELLLVDDNSPDGTAELARELSAEYPIRCHLRTDERGLATAVLAGLREAAGELVVVMDADLSHPPERIPDLLEALRDPQIQMAIGSRFVPGAQIAGDWPRSRHLNSYVARLLARPLTGVKDMMSGFFCVRRSELRLGELRPVGYKIALELIVRHRWTRVAEVPITFADRAAGQTKLNMSEQFRYIRHLVRLYGFVLSGGAPRAS